MKTKSLLIAFLLVVVFTSGFAVYFHSKHELVNADVSVASVNPNKIQIADYFFGFNTQMINGPDWSKEKFLSAVKKLQPQNLRYPGGTIANYWDWKTGWFLKSEDVPKHYLNMKPNPITLENFKIGIDATNAMPVYVLNVLTSDIKYQLEMLHHAKDIGMPVKLIELGNEFYGKEEAAIAKFPTGKYYALEANKWIVAIKKEFPEAEIAVVGCGKTDVPSINNDPRKAANPKERVENWDDELFSNVKGADAVTFHIYVGAGLNTGNSGGNKEEKINALNDAFATHVQSSLGMPFVKLQMLMIYEKATLPIGLKTWYTEYNLFEKNMVVSGTWTHGLYVSLLTLLFLQNERTELICNHNITKNARFAAIFNDDDGFENQLETSKTIPFGFSAGGACLSLVGEALKNKNAAQHLDFTKTKTLKTIKQVTYPSLFGYKFSGKKKESLIIFNLDASSISVDVKKVVSGNFQFKTYSSDPLKQIADDKQITVNTGELKGAVGLPGYSVTIIY